MSNHCARNGFWNHKKRLCQKGGLTLVFALTGCQSEPGSRPEAAIQSSTSSSIDCSSYANAKTRYQEAVKDTELSLQGRENPVSFLHYRKAVGWFLQAAEAAHVAIEDFPRVEPSDEQLLSNKTACCTSEINEEEKKWLQDEAELIRLAYFALETVQDFKVDPQVFPYKLPTAATEAKIMLSETANRTTPVEILDLAAGAGFAGMVAARRAAEAGASHVAVTFSDVDPAAIANLRYNVEHSMSRLPTITKYDFSVIESSLFDSLPTERKGQFDLVFSNPAQAPLPSIGSPGNNILARGGGGLSGLYGDTFHIKVAKGANEWLKPGGILYLQHFSFARLSTVKEALEETYGSYKTIGPDVPFSIQDPRSFWDLEYLVLLKKNGFSEFELLPKTNQRPEEMRAVIRLLQARKPIASVQ